MNDPPVLRARGWDGLIAALAAPPDPALPAGLDGKVARAVLAAPAAVALWIASREPQLLARRSLRLLVIGAETVDAADQGRWYALLPRLLDAGLEVEATLVGESLDPAFASSAAAAAPARAARLERAGLAGFLRSHDPGGFDLAVVFHPGLQKNRAWLADGSLARIVASGCALVASAYEQEEALVDAWVAEAHGYRVAGEPLGNPFYLDLSDGPTRVHWGGALWRFAPGAPPPGQPPDQPRLDALDLLSRMVMHSMLEGGGRWFSPGVKIELESSRGERRAFIHVFDRRCADPETGDLLALTDRGELKKIGTLAPAELASWPAGGSSLERALWAARIKAERFLPAGAPAREPGYGAARAADMVAALRERGRRLFRP